MSVTSASSEAQTSEAEESEETDEEYYIANPQVNAYQDEPLAAPGENERRAAEADEDGLLPATLDARFEGRIPLNEW